MLIDILNINTNGVISEQNNTTSRYAVLPLNSSSVHFLTDGYCCSLIALHRLTAYVTSVMQHVLKWSYLSLSLIKTTVSVIKSQKLLLNDCLKWLQREYNMKERNSCAHRCLYGEPFAHLCMKTHLLLTHGESTVFTSSS